MSSVLVCFSWTLECVFCRCWVTCSVSTHQVLMADRLWSPISLPIFCCFLVSYHENDVEISNYNCSLSVSLSSLTRFGFTYFAAFLFGANTCRIAIFWVDRPITKCHLLVIFFALMSTLPDDFTARHTCFCLCL